MLEFTNVNRGFVYFFERIKTMGEVEMTRNGPVYRWPEPVTWCFQRPNQRVLFNQARDANPFFHLYESMWMLAGRNDVDSVGHYCKQMYEYADDDGTINDAYGLRWRGWFDRDQLDVVVSELLADRTSRRVVLTMWDPRWDLGRRASKALPCNTHIYVTLNCDGLNMTICNRSNDLIWGAMGANAVHFSVLQEYLARAVGAPVGRMITFCNNLHAYMDIYDRMAKRPGILSGRSYQRIWDLVPMDVTPQQAEAFCVDGSCSDSQFLHGVVRPMMLAWDCHKARKYDEADTWVRHCTAPDWREAGKVWLDKREAGYLSRAKS